MNKIDEIIKFRDLSKKINQSLLESSTHSNQLIVERGLGKNLGSVKAAVANDILSVARSKNYTTLETEINTIKQDLKLNTFDDFLNAPDAVAKLSKQAKKELVVSILRTNGVDRDLVTAAAKNLTSADEWWKKKWNENGTALADEELETILKEKGYSDLANEELRKIYRQENYKYVGKFVKVDPTKRNVAVDDQYKQELFNKGKYEKQPKYELDANGDPKLDAQGNPIVKKDQFGNIEYEKDAAGGFMVKNKNTMPSDIFKDGELMNRNELRRYYRDKGTAEIVAGSSRKFRMLTKLKRNLISRYSRYWGGLKGWPKVGMAIAVAAGSGLLGMVFLGLGGAISDCLATRLSDEDFEKLKDVDNTQKFIEISNVGNEEFDKISGPTKFFYDKTLEKGGKKGSWKQNGKNIELILEGKSYIVECGDKSNETLSDKDNPLNLSQTEGTTSITVNGKTLTATLTYPIPPELDTEQKVRAFQDWLDDNEPNWAYDYKDGKLRQGKNGRGYGLYGQRTQQSWQKRGKDYIAYLENKNEDEFEDVINKF